MESNQKLSGQTVKSFDELFVFSFYVKGYQIFVENHKTGRIYERMYHEGQGTIQEQVIKLLSMRWYKTIGISSFDKRYYLIARKIKTKPIIYLNQVL